MRKKTTRRLDSHLAYVGAMADELNQKKTDAPTYWCTTLVEREIGAEYLHSIHGPGTVESCTPTGMGYRLTVRKTEGIKNR